MKSKPKKVELGKELKEGVIPKPKMITEKDVKKCSHSQDHHDSSGICQSCACLTFNGCGE